MIRIENLSKSYQMKNIDIPVLKNIHFSIDKGDMIALVGQSGAGKSTLLNIIGILDSYDSGSYYINNILIKDLTNQQATKYRNELIGFIFQQFHLIPFKTALENVVLPLFYQRVKKKERYEKGMEMLHTVGLSTHIYKKPNELSGGQQQRVAIARALVTNPPLILADEPTGALDSTTAQEILNLLKLMNKEGNTILIITHSSKIAAQCHKIREIVDGVIVS